MQTTLRIDDDLHRRAKMEALRRGITLTQLVEDGLRAQLDAEKPAFKLHTVASSVPFNFTPQQLKDLMNDDTEQLIKLGLIPEPEQGETPSSRQPGSQKTA
ncbi:toxin-antitoxin system HicB family antitoxin [Deinococcus sp.]|uniref:toxin-antitoxin system HicB family antitoxin n=1 Tax=Deinococcus sp. TaxID=47478 RepID=UPI003B58CDE4